MKRILFTLIAVVMCVAMIGSAFAYFTDVEKSTTNVMSAGTLDIQIKDVDEGWTDNPVTASFNLSGLAPGQTVTTNPVYFKNVGDINIYWLFARFCNLVEGDGTNTDLENLLTPRTDISKYIILQNYQESGDAGANWYTEDFTGVAGQANADAYLTYWNSRGASFILDQEISLYDLYVARNYGSGDKVTSLLVFDGGNFPTVPAIPKDGVVGVNFTFKLAETTPNNYQGDTASFEVDFIASANHVYPDDTIVESGLDAILGP